MISILSRSDTLCRLIKIRKHLYNRENCAEIKTKIDQLLLDIIGVSQENRYKINEILNKAISGEIKAKTAVVAIHEIIIDYNNLNNVEGEMKNTEENYVDEMEELYEKGYR